MRTFLKVFAIILAALIVSVCVAFAILTHDSDRDKLSARVTITDNSGNAFDVVVDTDGVTYAVVKDANSDIWQVAINDDGSLGETVASLNGFLSPEGLLTTAPTEQSPQSEPSPDDQSSTLEGTTEPSTTAPDEQNDTEDTTKKKKDDKNKADSTDTAETQKQLNFERYRDMLSSGNYYVIFTTNDPDLGEAPITSARKDSNLLVTTSIEGVTGKLIYRSDTGKTYLVIDEWQRYFSVPKRLLGDDINLEDMNLLANFFSENMNVKKFKVSSTELNGEAVTCESYTAKSGKVRNYYFNDSGTLVKIESIDEEGNVTDFNVSLISTVVSDELFSIPENYKYLNLSWL